MTKRLLCLFLAALLCICSACKSDETSVIEHVLTFTDDLGRSVTVPENPQRVAALIGSFADVWCLAGGKESLVAAADDTWTQFQLDLKDNVVHLGGVKAPNAELLLAADPDLVIASAKTSADVKLESVLNESGIPVLYFEVSSFDDYLRMLDICTQITGNQSAFTLYGEALHAQIEAAKSKVTGEEPSVLYVRVTGSGCKVKNSVGTVLGEMLADLDCRNIADSESGLLENLSLETILANDPDFIFAVLQGSDNVRVRSMLEESLLSNPVWNSLTAVQEGRFHILDQKLYNLKPNARWGEAYENLAEILYPQN